jgi:hypothetical protein
MRSFGTLIHGAKMREPEIPAPRLERARPPTLERLDEGILELFDHACMTGDLEMAADFVVLMERRHARHGFDDDQQRRTGGVHLKRMQGELDRRYIMKGIRPPNPELRSRWP